VTERKEDEIGNPTLDLHAVNPHIDVRLHTAAKPITSGQLVAEIERLNRCLEFRDAAVQHLRCKHDGDNDFIPEHDPGECAECDWWR
jgi:hypothetical protein